MKTVAELQSREGSLDSSKGSNINMISQKHQPKKSNTNKDHIVVIEEERQLSKDRDLKNKIKYNPKVKKETISERNSRSPPKSVKNIKKNATSRLF